MTLSVQETAEGLKGGFEYATDLFDHSTIERMALHWCALLEAMDAAPQCRLPDLPLLNQAERQQMLVERNATAREYGEQSRLHQLIERQAAETPQAVAVEIDGIELTYAELNRRANQLARLLRQKGVGPDVLVGVFAERSCEMVLSLLAVLKAGGAFVPLDPSFPADRLVQMLKDARAPVILAQPHLVPHLSAQAAEVLTLDASWAAYSGEAEADLKDEGTPSDLAYVIFTSGSTGRPKGAMNTHRGICNFLLWMQEKFGLTSSDRVVQNTPFGFDPSVWEIFLPLLLGARLVIARPEGHRDCAYLVGLISRSAITTLDMVPSMLRIFLEEEGLESCQSLKRVCCGGEALSSELQERFFARLPKAELHNLYGPTETAVAVTHWACRRGDPRHTVPIGRPVANTQVYVLDARMEPVPVGVAGELYVGGVQVGRGYVRRDDLTAERFVPDPFSSEPGARLYKTGDLARYLSDGAIEYLGRTDFQVKIRGQRIELGEIELLLAAHPDIDQAVVTAWENPAGNKRLVAYLVSRDGHQWSAEALRYFLRARLPDYMVPSTFIPLPRLPLTASGKVDRKSLPEPDPSPMESTRALVAPRTRDEERLATIWKQNLHVGTVGVNDDFFDLGGHSLAAMHVVSQVRQMFGCDLRLRDLFDYPTVAGLARAIHDRALLAPDPPPVMANGISLEEGLL